MMEDYARAQAVKTKVSGRVVQDLIPLFVVKMKEDRKNGRHLGEFIKLFRGNHGDDGVLGMSKGELETNLVNEFETFRKSIGW